MDICLIADEFRPWLVIIQRSRPVDTKLSSVSLISTTATLIL
jgi:hypothetical protein